MEVNDFEILLIDVTFICSMFKSLYLMGYEKTKNLI